MTIIQTTGVAVTEWEPGALVKFGEQLLTELARAVHGARPNSPIARAQDNLGERFWGAVHFSLRRHLNEAIWQNEQRTLALLNEPDGKKQLVDDLIVAVLGEVVHRANLKGRVA